MAPTVFRRAVAAIFTLSIAFLVLHQSGCGDSSGDSTFGDGSGGDSGVTDPSSSGGFDPGKTGDGGSGGNDPDASGTLTVTPATVTLTVNLANGVPTIPSQTFTASYDGTQVNATWLFDRGELGDVTAAGVFKPSGTNVGEGILTARYGSREGTAKVKIVLVETQNGNGQADAGTGAGGLGGVGGEPLGAAVDPSIITKLKGAATAPASEAELGFLYPYDQTVWPRGLLAPLLMWQTTHDGSAVYIKLSQANYTFEGTYVLAGTAAAKKRARIEQDPWRVATGGNQGDDLKLEVRVYSATDDKVYGPISRTWKVAPGVLKGTVYYNSYDSKVTTGGGAETGGVIKIKPSSPDPVLALPQRQGQCHVCHALSADGSTLFVQDGKVDFNGGGDDYRNGRSYDLKQNPPTETAFYNGASTGALDRRFVWSAPYPDGSFALASTDFAREAYLQTDSKLFKRSDASEATSAGLTTAVKSAVTPAFSPDGRKVSFNFYEGPGANGVTAGAGRSLALMDFACGAAAGSVTCTTSGTFSNLRELYKDANRWPGWPSFLPDGKAVIFHNTVQGGDVGSGGECRANIVVDNNIHNCQLTTWLGATAEVWLAEDAATPKARRLDALNGVGSPNIGTNHGSDFKLNYNPTVNPVPSGGFYWVVFTSRRAYGNLLTADPWGSSSQKKLWVAAVDIGTGAIDPSHPAFYLPGQELGAGNTRGFWVVDPCKANGNECETGDECCNGFCRKDEASGKLVCKDKPPTQCSQEFEKCAIDADCCDPTFKCIAGKCSRPAQGPK